MLENSRILRGPYQMSIDITNKCNLRCLHCYNYSGENNCINDELTDEELIKVIEDVAKMDILNICFCGGETLLRKNILLKLIKILSDKGIKTSMVTNGILLTEEVAQQLKDAGISKVQISLDGIGESHEKLRGMKGAYEKAVQALKNLQHQEIDSGIAFSPTEWNIEDFKDVFKLAVELDVKELRVQALMPIGRGSQNIKIIPTNDQYRKLITYIKECKEEVEKSSIDMDIQWGDPIDHLIRFPLIISRNVNMTIKANGNITPSIYLPLSLGNVRKHSIIDYWNAGMYKAWTLDIVKDMAEKYTSVIEMGQAKESMPTTFLEEDIYYDLIDKKC